MSSKKGYQLDPWLWNWGILAAKGTGSCAPQPETHIPQGEDSAAKTKFKEE